MNPRRRRRRKLPRMAGHRIVRGHYRHNPGRRGGGGGGIGMMPLLLIGGAAYFLFMRPGGAFGATAQPAIPGYTALGGNYYRNQATGQTVYRNPTTGTMTTATGAIAPSGVPTWLQPTVQAGAQAIPQLGIGLVQGLTGALTSGIRSLFGDTSVVGTSAGAVATESGALTTTAPDVLSGAYTPPSLPADIVMPTPIVPWGQWLEGGVISPETQLALPSYTDIFASEATMPLLSMDLAPVDTSGWFADYPDYAYM